MRRKILTGFIFAASLIIILFIVFRGRSPFGKSNSSFASKPAKEITRIVISDENRSLSLEATGGKWLVNSGAEARKSGISFITSIITEMRIKSPVSEELFNKEISANQLKPVSVRVYEKRKLLKRFLVYKTGSNSYGNIMKIKSRSKPFIVYLPGFEGDVGSVFTTNELYWKPFVVFNILPSEIAKVRLDNFADTALSFSIVNKQGRYFVSGAAKELSGWDSSRVKRYISYFTFIPFDEWAEDISAADIGKVGLQNPLYRISVTNQEGQERVLDLWERTLSGIAGVTTDSDRLLGKLHGEDHFFIIRYFDIDPLLKKRAYFFPR